MFDTRVSPDDAVPLVVRYSKNGCCRRVSPVAPHAREGPLTEPTAGAQPWRRGGRVRLGIGSGIAQRIARLGTRYRPLAALADAVQIVRGLLRHETVTYRGRAFSADRVALEFTAPRPGMPIHLAAMADRSLALRGRLADGLIVSNLCPPAYTARAVAIVRESAAVAGRESIASSPSGIRRLTARAKYAASAVGCGPAKLSASSSTPARRYCAACAMTCSAVPASAKMPIAR